LTSRLRAKHGVAIATAALLLLFGVWLDSTRTTQASVSLAAGPIGTHIDLLDSTTLMLQPRENLPPLAPAATVAAAPAPEAPRPRPPVSQERVIAPPPDRFVGETVPNAAPPKQLTDAPPTPGKGGTWAVMMGINNYPGSDHDLKSAVNDANDMDEALARFGVPSDHRLVMRDGQVSSSTMRASVDWLVRNAGPDSTAVFFYAGHVRKHGSSTEALVAADGSTMNDSELASRLSGLRAPRAWIAIAGCYGGGFTEVLKPGRVLTGAAPSNQLAYENSGFGRSYMVQYMVREAMIEGRAGSTAVEPAFQWADSALARDYPNRRPVEFDSASGFVDLRPAGAPPPNYSKPPAPSNAGTGSGGGSSGGGSPPPSTTTTTAPQDNCSLSFGLVKCQQGDPHEGNVGNIPRPSSP